MTALINLATAKALMPIRANDNSQDDLLKSLIEIASNQLERYCRRSFASQEYTELFHTQDTRTRKYNVAGSTGYQSATRVEGQARSFFLKGWPVATSPAITVNYDPRRDFNAQTQLNAADKGYYLEADDGILNLYIATVKGADLLQVVYTAGFASQTDDGFVNLNDAVVAAAPALAEACARQVAFLYKTRAIENIGTGQDRTSKGEDNAVDLRGTDLANEATAMVRHLVRPLHGKG